MAAKDALKAAGEARGLIATKAEADGLVLKVKRMAAEKKAVGRRRRASAIGA